MVKSTKSESVRKKSRQQHEAATKKNPFEFKFAKQKHAALGQKRKLDIGMPGAGRKKAMELRQRTLLTEYRNFGKNNRLNDKRLGEHDANMSKDEKLSKRYALQKSSKLKRNRFHLNDAEDGDSDSQLTHYGQSLSHIQKYEKPESDDEDERGMQRDFVKMAHFGGGDDNEKQNFSRKEMISLAIAKSKESKAERCKEKDEMTALTEDLDEQWKKLAPSISAAFTKDKAQAPKPTPKEFDYDLLLYELQTKPGVRARAADKLKTPEDTAKEELERLQDLENQRIARMNTAGNSKTERVFASADDQPVEPVRKSERRVTFQVEYDRDGKLVNTDKLLVNNVPKKKSSRKQNESNHSGDDFEASDDNVSDGENESDEEDEMDDFGRIDEDSSATSSSTTSPPSKRKLEEMPFVINAPADYEQFRSLINTYHPPTATAVHTLCHRIIKCTHPSLAVGNKDKIQRLFLFMLRSYHAQSTACSPASYENSVQIMSGLTQSMYDAAQLVPNHAARCFKALVNKHRSEIRKQRLVKEFPGPSVFTLLKLIPVIFPVTDFVHPVVTPALMLASKLLRLFSKRSSSLSKAKGIVLVHTLIPYIQDSKRYIPTISGFIQSVLNGHYNTKDCLLDEKVKPISIKSLFSDHEPVNKSTLINCSTKLIQTLLPIWSVHPSAPEIFRFFCRRLSDNVSPNLNSETSKQLKRSIDHLIEQIESAFKDHRRTGLWMKPSFGKTALSGANAVVHSEEYPSAPPPQSAKFEFLEPRMESDFDPERNTRGRLKGAAGERQKLKAEVKKEKRATIRELRWDNRFIASQRTKETADKDMDRKLKTKKLMASLMGQEAEFQKYKRMMDHKK